MRKAAIQTRSATPIRLQLSQIIRRAVEDAAALAFAKLPAQRQTALIAAGNGTAAAPPTRRRARKK